MLPCHPAESTRALIDRLARAAGAPIRTRTLPGWLLRLLGVHNACSSNGSPCRGRHAQSA